MRLRISIRVRRRSVHPSVGLSRRKSFFWRSKHVFRKNQTSKSKLHRCVDKIMKGSKSERESESESESESERERERENKHISERRK